MKANTSRDIIGRYFNTLAGIMMASWAFRIAHFNANSDQDAETYLQFGATPQFKEWLGNRSVKDVDPTSITIGNVKYEATLRDFADNFKFDKTGQLMTRVNGFAKRGVTHWGKLVTDLLRLGDSTAGADGANFFSAAHHGSQNNLLTASDNALLNVATATNPTAAEMANVIGAVVAIMQGWVDDQDEPMNEDAQKFLVMVPPNMGFAAQQVVTKSVLAGGVDNPLLDTQYEINVQVNARLNQSGEKDDFYVFRLDGDTKPIILQEQSPLQLSSKAEGSDYYHDTDKWEFGAKATRGVGFFNWENAAKVTLS